MLEIEFIYDQSCPNIKAGRKNLLKALEQMKLPQKWTDWERNDPKAPDHVRLYGSPTILVNGSDITKFTPSDEGNSCRVYVGEDGTLQGVPSVALITQALKKIDAIKTKGSFSKLLALLPVIGAVTLPKLTCPACWPAYATLLGYFGISFVNYTPYLLPMTLIFVGLILFSLVFRAAQRRGYRPFFLGVTASTILIIGKFYFASDTIMYLGLGLLIASSIWNTWPKRGKYLKTTDSNCPSCKTVNDLNSKTGD